MTIHILLFKFCILFQRALSLLQDGSLGLEKLCPAQLELEQVFREDREADDKREPAERLLVGDESGKNLQDGRGGRQVVEERSRGHQEGHAHAR